MKKVDAIIIGGGILARVLSYMMSRCRGLNEALIISSVDQHTASIQNQAWLQSGLLYGLEDAVSRQAAELCILHGRKLLDMRNISITERFGVMALADEAKAREKIDFLKRFGFPGYGGILGRTDVERFLGRDFSQSAHFTRDTCFIRTPDQPFDEGGLLRFCETALRKAVFPFRPIQGNATIKINAIARNGYSILVNGEEFDPKMLFVVAGVNTLRFLSPLRIGDQINLKARRCILMKAPLFTDLAADLYMDTLSDLNVNTVTNRRGEKVCLFGDSLYSHVKDLTQELLDRTVTSDDKRKFLDNLCSPNNYPHLKERLLPFMADDQSFSVCYKIEGQGVLPWIFETADFAPNFPNMYIAGPGKATMAYYAAHDLLTRANINIEAEFGIPPIILTSSDINMWFDLKNEML